MCGMRGYMALIGIGLLTSSCVAVVAAAALEGDRQGKNGRFRRQATFRSYADNKAALERARVDLARDPQLRALVDARLRENQRLFDVGDPLAMNTFSSKLERELDAWRADAAVNAAGSRPTQAGEHVRKTLE